MVILLLPAAVAVGVAAVWWHGLGRDTRSVDAYDHTLKRLAAAAATAQRKKRRKAASPVVPPAHVKVLPGEVAPLRAKPKRRRRKAAA